MSEESSDSEYVSADEGLGTEGQAKKTPTSE